MIALLIPTDNIQEKSPLILLTRTIRRTSASNEHDFHSSESNASLTEPLATKAGNGGGIIYAAVAEKISTFLASVNTDRAIEKMAVNKIINPILSSILFTK